MALADAGGSTAAIASGAAFAIRQYALALLNTACAMAPDLIPADRAADWASKLVTKDPRVFSCTAIVTNNMRQSVQTSIATDAVLSGLFNATYPTDWR